MIIYRDYVGIFLNYTPATARITVLIASVYSRMQVSFVGLFCKRDLFFTMAAPDSLRCQQVFWIMYRVILICKLDIFGTLCREFFKLHCRCQYQIQVSFAGYWSLLQGSFAKETYFFLQWRRQYLCAGSKCSGLFLEETYFFREPCKFLPPQAPGS